jgi:hypothetical protein
MHTIRNDSMKSALLLVVISKLGVGSDEHGQLPIDDEEERD